MRFFYFLFIFINTGLCFAQNYSELVNTTPVFVEKVDITLLKENQLYISMPFAKKIVLNPNQKKQLTEKVVIKLELVYTEYRTSNTFNQKKLNSNRLKELNKLAPTVFENRFWDFQLTSQTKAESRESGNKMFHGFIVTFRPNSTSTTLKKEVEYLNAIVTTMLKNDSIEKDTLPQAYKIKTHYDKNKGYIHDTIWHIDTIKPPNPPDFFYNQSLYNDSTVLNSFARNNSWKNFIVVTDVTGSMSPYSAQVFVWLKAQADNKLAKCFVFFNDGDEKPSRKKQPLETKGVYLTKNSSITNVINTAAKCMKNGSGGGENLENDVEAIIEGLKQHPEVSEAILVADNMESMRDYKFLNKIKRPVHVILCGSENRINIQYLDLARQTKGSVHTKNSDIINLQEIKEKEHFFIEKKEYLFENGQFHFVY
ncbi:MAG: hypothetical protein P8Q14_08975 [Vicingaceae bacterium]|nr:hypothetical protein [Vicingaceae bacterium]